MIVATTVRVGFAGLAVAATLLSGGVALAAITPTPGTVADPGIGAPTQNAPGGVILGGVNVGPLGVGGLNVGPDGAGLGGIDLGALGL